MTEQNKYLQVHVMPECEEHEIPDNYVFNNAVLPECKHCGTQYQLRGNYMIPPRLLHPNPLRSPTQTTGEAGGVG